MKINELIEKIDYNQKITVSFLNNSEYLFCGVVNVIKRGELFFDKNHEVKSIKNLKGYIHITVLK